MGQLQLSSLLNQKKECDCGREHLFSIKKMQISPHALQHLGKILNECGYTHPLFVYDQTTHNLLGEKIASILKDASIAGDAIILPFDEPIPDEYCVGKVLTALQGHTDVLIAVGSGTINDLSKYVSYKAHLDYGIIATAPSMDGYTSTVAPLIVDNIKLTYDAQLPSFFIGDLHILKDAPMNMIAAGVGDILGKYSSLVDWQLSAMVNDEYYCETLAGIVRESIRGVVDNIEQISNRDMEGIRHLIEALVLSGIAMSYSKNSRPASGSEHHLAHYWEIQTIARHEKIQLHGVKVGVATIQVLKMWRHFLEKPVDFQKATKNIDQFSYDQWTAFMKKAYGDASGTELIAFEALHQKNAPEQVKKRIAVYEKKMNAIRTMAQQHLPLTEVVVAVLEKVQGKTTPSSVSLDFPRYAESVIAAKELRNRYGFFQLLFDLGLLEEMAMNPDFYE